MKGKDYGKAHVRRHWLNLTNSNFSKLFNQHHAPCRSSISSCFQNWKQTLRTPKLTSLTFAVEDKECFEKSSKSNCPFCKHTLSRTFFVLKSFKSHLLFSCIRMITYFTPWIHKKSLRTWHLHPGTLKSYSWQQIQAAIQRFCQYLLWMDGIHYLESSEMQFTPTCHCSRHIRKLSFLWLITSTCTIHPTCSS